MEDRGLFVGGEATAAVGGPVGKGNRGGFTTKYWGGRGRPTESRRRDLVTWWYGNGRRESGWTRAPAKAWVGIAAALLRKCVGWQSSWFLVGTLGHSIIGVVAGNVTVSCLVGRGL